MQQRKGAAEGREKERMEVECGRGEREPQRRERKIREMQRVWRREGAVAGRDRRRDG